MAGPCISCLSSNFLRIVDSLGARGRRLMTASLLACSFVGIATIDSLAEISCRPLLSITNVREIRASLMAPAPWSWRASVVVDARFCATRYGNFEIDFIRIKEYAPDMQFTERFRWNSTQLDVPIDLVADEAIIGYRIGFVAPCVCREFPFDD